MNLSERFRAGELLTGVAVGAGIVAATGWSAVWVMLLSAAGAILTSLLARQWITGVAVGLALWVALPVWSEVLPTGSSVPEVGDLIGETTTTTGRVGGAAASTNNEPERVGS